ncbi:VCBS repeat-containing protein [Flagellimonas iocasae]|uniref:VCBS repeat-containing protein n=1 Tax=Flagellimonas iocasae TaxID=2055905 RepID=A0ABW4Y2F2_9FLAO
MCLIILLFLASCSSEEETSSILLQLTDYRQTGIDFRNDIHEDVEENVFTYTNFFNGGGVAIGDIDNDGLVDIYFSANQKTGKLYLNKGDFKFEDITKGSGLDTISGWKTGVTMVDINQDGFLDIYVCRSGDTKPRLRSNLLFINNGDKTFVEKGKEYGLDDWSNSIQATFFDYDLDGDLDMFLLNHAVKPIKEIFRNFHDKDVDRFIGDKLYKNNNGHYTQVKDFVGINRSKLGDGLGVAIVDFNQDLYPDIYVCNDFAGRDYLYFNNGDGTFKESALTALNHISYASMGADAADINNDGLQDLFVLDMNSTTNLGRKTNMGSMDPEAFNLLVSLDGHYQYMRNTLQLNNGNGTFSDVAPMAGVSSTDWSWAPLFVDLDNDGFNDLFVTNGMRKNTNNKDFEHFKDERILEETNKPVPDFEAMVQDILDSIPPEKSVNLVFKNQGGLSFSKANDTWGVSAPSYSNGAAYADLDNDGDMDLVINNIDEEAHVYRNHATSLTDNHFIKIKLKGSPKNVDGIGAKVNIKYGENKQYKEQYVVRGYQSNVDYILHFGVGQSSVVDKITVTWPSGKASELKDVPVDQQITIDHAKAGKSQEKTKTDPLLFTNVTANYNVNYKHQENDYDDFSKEILLPHKMSTFGPALAVGDVDGDGLEDFYVGGAKDFEGAIYLQGSNNTFTKKYNRSIVSDKFHEDTDALFFDADMDGDLDLFVVSGGNEMPEGDTYYHDRLYLNQGKGNFVRALNALPTINSSGGVVRAADYDNDGDLDLFVGGRLLPGQYPKPGQSYLLENQNGKFRDVTKEKAPDLQFPGMVTDAVWSDYNNNGTQDLILVGEWMPITIFENNQNKFTKNTDDPVLNNSAGWWFSITEADINNDGRADYLVGNLGENYKYKTAPNAPFRLYSKDFDNNGSLDIVLSYVENDTLYPLRGKSCSSQQIPSLKEKFKDYRSFGMASLTDVYDEDALKSSDLFEAKTFSSALLINTNTGFQLEALPKMAQISPVFGSVYDDFDNDDINDIVIAGNLFNSEIETPRADAGQGLFLKGNGKGGFNSVNGFESGLFISGDVKKLKPISLGPNAEKGLISAVNNGNVALFKAYNGQTNKSTSL